MAHYFGVRHFSPACAYYVREFLDCYQPELVLIEGPSDLSGLAEQLCGEQAVLPAAILAYTEQSPVRTVLYPFAEFSPEYQAILWAKEHGAKMRFCDLPSGCVLEYYARKDEPDPQERESVYARIEQLTGLDNDTFWEYNFEQAKDLSELLSAVREYGRGLREFSPEDGHNALREAYMRRVIHEAEQSVPAGKIAVITGAFHTGGLEDIPYSEADEKLTENIPSTGSLSTLMPYSYYRLSQRSGYGAGSKAPGFFEILWHGRLNGRSEDCAAEYLARIAEGQRKRGGFASSAEVIEALRLAETLAQLRGGKMPALSDLRDAAVTCMGHGSFGEISVACADIEIGTKIGSLPEGSVSTSVQRDFMRQLAELKMERYRSACAEELKLDLRENIRVKTEKSAFLDLNRSFFLHRIRVLDIGFGALQPSGDSSHTELWQLRWSPECEIRLVEASLLGGDTIEQACELRLAEKLYAAESLPIAAKVLQDAFLCGITGAVDTAVPAVGRLAADCVSACDCADTISTLSAIIRFGSIRRLDTAPLAQLMKQLYLRFCLSLPSECVCDENAAHELMNAVSAVNDAALSHPELSEERFVRLLFDLADSDMASPLLSGYACAVLTDRGRLSAEKLAELISRRLSKGTPAAEGALWFEGLAAKNRRALIARLSLWEKLCEFIGELSDEEFKPALVCLRRTFAVFSPGEKADIAENIGEVLGISAQAAAEMISAPMTAEEQETISGLDDFDFEDI